MMGKFIVIEGPDGTGKSTLVAGLKDRLQDRKVKFFREPGGSDLGERIRELVLSKDTNISPSTEALLFAAMRSENFEMLKDDLREYELIIADRFLMSSLCYQGAGLELGLDRVEMINDFALGGFRPDLNILLIMDADKGIDRKSQQRSLDRLELRGLDFHERVEAQYRALMKQDKTVVIDASASKDEVLDQVYDIICSFMGWDN